MTYQKKFMTITELTKVGLSREDLECWVHIKDFPSMRVGKRGHWRVNTDYLDAWLIKKGYMKKPSEDLIKLASLLSVNKKNVSFIDELIKIKEVLDKTKISK